jgi:hypothetical protein
MHSLSASRCSHCKYKHDSTSKCNFQGKHMKMHDKQVQIKAGFFTKLTTGFTYGIYNCTQTLQDYTLIYLTIGKCLTVIIDKN